MNALLEKALEEVARLPEEEQEVIATLILEEIAAERGWDERFAGTRINWAPLCARLAPKWRVVM